MEYIMIGVWFLVFFGGGWWARSSEKKRWNNGVCSVNGIPWEHFDTDSQGGRGYKADEHYMWASYRIDV
jgi:hypothetical protein